MTPMKRVGVGVALALLVVGAAPALCYAKLPAKERSELEAAVRRGFGEASAPGVIAAVQTPKGKWFTAIGKKAQGSKAPVRRAMHQRIGSVTKTFVGAAFMQLVGEHKLSLDDTVSQYIAGVPSGDEMTLREVADMTSGVISYTAIPSFTDALYADPFRSWRPGELLQIGLANPLEFQPGTGFQYSDSNYILLGLVIQQVEGRPIGAVLRRRIIKPLKLSGTSWPGKSLDLPKPHAKGDTLQGQPSDVPGNSTHWNPSYAWAAGALVSTVRDLLTYGRATGTGKGLLTPRLQKLRMSLFEPTIPPESPTLSYGIGLVDDAGWIGHTGQVPGYTTALYHNPAIKTTVVVEANSDIASGTCRGQETLSDDPFRGQCATPADRIMGRIASALGKPYQLPPG